MKSAQVQAQTSDQDSTRSIKTSCRRRPLHTWGVSAIAIVNRAYIKAQALNEPLALMAANLLTLITHLVSYFIHCLQHFWLSIFFFVDDCILTLENMVETVFPPSKHVFDKVDEVTETIETLPGKFDDVLNEFPVIIKQVPLLDWTLSLAISWLKLILTRWSIENIKEKDIVVDQNEEKSINDDETRKKPENKAEKFRVSPISATGTYKGTYKDVLLSKGTYKDVLVRGNRENNVTKKKKKVGVQTTDLCMCCTF